VFHAEKVTARVSTVHAHIVHTEYTGCQWTKSTTERMNDKINNRKNE